MTILQRARQRVARRVVLKPGVREDGLKPSEQAALMLIIGWCAIVAAAFVTAVALGFLAIGVGLLVAAIGLER